MSWSIHLVGRPSNISKELDAHSEKLTGDSKKEFDGAKPHMQALLAANYFAAGSDPAEPMMELVANGHASRRADGTFSTSSCSASLKNVQGKPV